MKAWLAEQIDQAIAAGYTTFITGCGMGVDIWAAQIVLEKRQQNPSLKLIAASPWPGFSSRWNEEWKGQYADILRRADLTVYVSKAYTDGVFKRRNEWMVEHSSRLIAYYNGAAGGTRNTIEYAKEKGIEVFVGQG